MSSKTEILRLVMPQWQGGNNPAYHFGAQLLAWLAPETGTPVVTVPVAPPVKALENEKGIVGRSQLVEQLASARALIAQHSPDKLVVLGGDCLVDLAPFAWLSERYKEKLGVLWIDAHPDVMTPTQFEHAHAHVLGALLGNGDADLTSAVTTPIVPSRVMIAGINEPLEYEANFIREYGINTISPDEIRADSTRITEWIKAEGIEYLAIHFDLDVLDYTKFRSVLFARPDGEKNQFDGIAKGKLEINEVLSLIQQVNTLTTIVGLGIAEHLPWDMINLKSMLSQLPLLNGK